MKNIPQVTTLEFSSLVGIPYENMNCWDLAVKFYSDILGLSLHNFWSGPTPHRSMTQNLIYTNKGEFEKVDSPQFGDIILIRLQGYESHIGIYVGDEMMLHSTRGNGSVMERLSRWRNLIVGYYRIGKKNV